MSIIISNLSYAHPNREPLFDNVSFSLPDGHKASLIGDNGTGKTTLLRIIGGKMKPASGSVATPSTPYFVPQHFGQYDTSTVAEALGIDAPIKALHAILGGNLSAENYTLLDDRWDIEDKLRTALDNRGLAYAGADTPMSSLSGGEKTKVFLAGIGIHSPEVILMDEPTNHLDRAARERLYEFIRESRATILVVSHDRELLDMLDTTFELTRGGVSRYGGNYTFYKEQRNAQLQALGNRVAENEKALRAARQTARDAAERKARMDARGEQKQKKAGVARILMNTIRDGAEKSASRLKDVHSEKIGELNDERRALREQLPDGRDMKIKIDASGLHRGKTLFTARGLNFSYGERKLWAQPLDIQILSGERIAISGANGSGKTTLLKIITGQLLPTEGTAVRTDFSYAYIDQEYSMIDDSLTVVGQLESCNKRNLPDHELKTELHRFMFPQQAWDKRCAALSGGEKMRLMLCCMEVGDSSPDMIILDEPTNNLDIKSIGILTATMSAYRGTLLVISHDSHFLTDIGVAHEVELGE